jgi:hypothetical protein
MSNSLRPETWCVSANCQLRDRLVGAGIGLVHRGCTRRRFLPAGNRRSPVIARSASPSRRVSSIPCASSSNAMSSSVSQIGISIATVTQSLMGINRCSVSCRNLLLPTAGMMNAAVSVAPLCFEFTTMRETSANDGSACEARAFGPSSRRNRSCGQVVGTLSRKSASVRDLASPRCLSSSVPERRLT